MQFDQVKVHALAACKVQECMLSFAGFNTFFQNNFLVLNNQLIF